MIVLAIESSCDETAAAVVRENEVLSNVIASQAATHAQYGGVYPEIASRMHMEVIDTVVRDALSQANVRFGDITHVAVTTHPGLIGALLVGVCYARGLAYALSRPLIEVNHVEAHIVACEIEHTKHTIEYPHVSLVVSGGHSSLYVMQSRGDYTCVGRTRDDAAGEAFDKVARTLGLSYPGGPAIQQAAMDGNADAFAMPKTRFPDSYDFSFSGIKTHVLSLVNRLNMKGEAIPVADIAASFQRSMAECLIGRLSDVGVAYDARTVSVCGGVACNAEVRRLLRAYGDRAGVTAVVPSPVYCTDNAVMVGVRAMMDT